MRVENALQFATALAQQEGVLDEFQKAMQEDEETSSSCPTKSPCGCSTRPHSGTARSVQFRPDVYGWDDNVAKALELAPGAPRKIEQPESCDDIGP